MTNDNDTLFREVEIHFYRLPGTQYIFFWMSLYDSTFETFTCDRHDKVEVSCIKIRILNNTNYMARSQNKIIVLIILLINFPLSKIQIYEL